MTEKTELSRWEQAQANYKESQRLLKEAQSAFARGDVQQKRVDELTRLKDIAEEDYLRCEKEHRSGLTDS